MSPSRERAASLGLCVAGAALMLLAGGQAWFTGRESVDGLPTTPLRVTGRDVAAIVSAVGLLALAGAGVVLLIGGLARRVVGGILAVGALAAAVRVVQVTALDRDDQIARVLDTTVAGGAVSIRSSATAWPWVALVGALLVLAGGSWVLASAGRWPKRSRRYDADGPSPAGKTSAQPADDSDALWKAIDRGEDPTDQRPS